MRFLWKNHFDNAVTSLQANKGRAAMAIIGVTIGVAGITTVVSLTRGSTIFLDNQAVRAKDGVAVVRSGLKPTTDLSLSDNQQLITNTLTKKDADDLTHIPHAGSAPMALMRSKLTAGKTTIESDKTMLVGSTPALQTVAELPLRKDSQFIDEGGGIVLGNQLSIDLFGTEESLGNIVHVRGKPLTVVGVIRPIDQASHYLGVNFDNTAIVPLSVLTSLNYNNTQIQQIVIKTDTPEQIKEAVVSANKILNDNHRGDNDYHIITGEEIVAPNKQLVRMLSTVITAISGVALLIGGIGIMSIMLVNVAERRHEIAIRRAVGATRGDIVNQFLID